MYIDDVSDENVDARWSKRWKACPLLPATRQPTSNLLTLRSAPVLYLML